MSGPDERPLVVSLALDDDSQARLDALRRAHFPSDRNHLPAHVTLFHALPGAEVDLVRRALAGAADRPAFAVEAASVQRLGRGTAVRLASRDLDELHAGLLRELRARLGDALTRQDRQRLSAHVTVQNKVAPEAARALHERLAATWEPFSARAAALDLWRYDGGPWEPVEAFPFA